MKEEEEDEEETEVEDEGEDWGRGFRPNNFLLFSDSRAELQTQWEEGEDRKWNTALPL